jgi:hypothetical protein
MTSNQPGAVPKLIAVTTATNELEAAMIAGCLTGAGIPAIYRQSFRSSAGPRAVYVNEDDLARAQETLSSLETSDGDSEDLAAEC